MNFFSKRLKFMGGTGCSGPQVTYYQVNISWFIWVCITSFASSSIGVLSYMINSSD